MERYITDTSEILKSMKRSRERAGIKQEIIAFDLKIDRSTYNKLENGKIKMKLELFVQIAEKINITPAEILFGAKKLSGTPYPLLLIRTMISAILLIEEERNLIEGSDEELQFIISKLKDFYSKRHELSSNYNKPS
jgi:DNA-binding XRE family transcriptional regulator